MRPLLRKGDLRLKTRSLSRKRSLIRASKWDPCHGKAPSGCPRRSQTSSHSQTIPDASRHSKMRPKHMFLRVLCIWSVSTQTLPDIPRRFQTLPDIPRRFQTLPNAPKTYAFTCFVHLECIHPDAPRHSQTLPDAPRHSQNTCFYMFCADGEYPPRRSQTLPDAPRRFHTLPDGPKRVPDAPKR